MTDASTSRPATLDLAPLLDPVQKAEERAFAKAAAARGEAPGPGWNTGAVLGALGLTAVVGVVGLLIASSTRSSLGVVFVLFFAVAVVAALVNAFRGLPWQRWARLDRFARANGMRFIPRQPGSGETGMIFGRGHTRITSERMLLGDGWLDGRVETANYRYSITTGSGKNRRTRVYRWAYLVIQLDRKLPQLVLDNVQNDTRVFGLGGSNLPARFDAAQRLGLEGDFDTHFRLYAPAGYERDALYVLTPDLMALLIDQVGSGTPLDVEIVDDRMYFYASGTLDFGDPGVWQRLTGIVRTVGSKTLRQTVRYADDRVGDRALNVVAPEGRRLKRGNAAGVVVIALLFAIGWIVLNVLFNR